MGHDSAIPAWFSRMAHRGESQKAEVGIVLVANVQGRTTPIQDYSGDSIITEFLSDEELDTVIEYFQRAELYCEVLLDEDGFLKWLGEGRFNFPRRHAFVYNLAQNGIGPGRLTTVAGLCRLHGIPLLDSDAHAVAVAQHKFHSLSLLGHFALPVARVWLFSEHGWWPTSPPMGSLLIAKPTYESASIGVDEGNIFTLDETAKDMLRHRIATYRQPLTVQEFIPGFELEVPVFEADGPRVLSAIGISLCGQPYLGTDILTYDRVFDDDYSFYNFADECPATAEEALAVACRAFRGLGLSGIARVDYRATRDGTLRIMEVACKPHITTHSSFMSTLRSVGLSGVDLAHFLVGSTTERYQVS